MSIERKPNRIGNEGETPREIIVRAENVLYDNTNTGDKGDNVKTALDNIVGRVASIEQNGGGGGSVAPTSYAGKKFAVIGDSFSSPNEWQTVMCQLLGATLIKNGAQAVGAADGSRFGGADSNKWGYTRAQELFTHCSNNNVTPDYILICLGTNDIANMRGSGSTLGSVVYDAEAGDIGDTLVIDNSHLTAGMQATILYLKDKFPNAKIMVGPTPAGNLHSGESLLDTYRPSFLRRLQDVCLMYGLQWLDCYYACIDYYGVTADSQFNKGAHPTSDGRKLIGNFMAGLLKSFLL